jgi:uncharacterized cupredoxin-like copper-binding protein
MTLKTLAAGAVLALAVAACGTGAATSAPASPAAASAPAASVAPAGSTSVTAITERDFRFDTPDVTVSGSPQSLAVMNAGPTVHDLTIRDAAGTVLGETDDLKSGSSETITVDLPAGAYTIFCSLPGHESLGLRGTLTVTK